MPAKKLLRLKPALESKEESRAPAASSLTQGSGLAPVKQVIDLKAFFKMEQIKQTFNAFEADFLKYYQLHASGATTARSLELAFNKLKPHIQKLDGCLKQLDEPDLIKHYSKEIETHRDMFLVRIGLSYTLHQEYAKARPYYQKAQALNASLQGYINLTRLEMLAGASTATIIKAQEDLLHAARLAKHQEEAQKYKKELNEDLSQLLARYVMGSKPGINFRLFFKENAFFFSLENFDMLFLFYKDSPQELTYWLSILFQTSLHIPQKYHIKYAQLLLQTNHPTECINHIAEHQQQFDNDVLTRFTKILLQEEPLDPKQLDIVVSWLTATIEAGSIYATKCFVDICLSHRHVFKPEIAAHILSKACASEDQILKGGAHYILGTFYESGFGAPFAQSQADAFHQFKLAADNGSTNACKWLAEAHAHGISAKLDIPLALSFYEKAHDLDSIDAGVLWAELVVNSIALHPEKLRIDMLHKGLAYAEASELRLAQLKDLPVKALTDLRAKIFCAKATCLMLIDTIGFGLSDILPRQQSGAFLYSIGFDSRQKNPTVVDLFRFAADEGSGDSQFEAAIQLAQFYFKGFYVEQDLNQALQYFQKSIPLIIEYELGSFLEFYALIMCSLILQQLSEQASSDYEKKRLQYQALAYSQAAVAIDAESIPEEIKTFVNSLYKKDKTITVTPEASQAIFQALSARLQAPKPDWKIPAAALQALLNTPNLDSTPETILKATQYISDLGEHFLEVRHLFPQLEELVANAVTKAKPWPEHELRAVFAAVGKWHLAGASIALERLFLHLPSHLPDLSFSDWCEYLTYFAKCNFTKDFQTANVLPLVKRFATSCFADTLKTGTFSLSDAARLFHTLALFDCNAPDDTFLQLATSLFAAVKPKLAEALPSDVSQLYHAYHYFRLSYPDSPEAPNKHWRLGADLRHLFQIYKLSLVMPEQLRISRAQSTMHGLLLQIHPKILHEQFIEAAGRRVDFLVLEEDFIIQYNGALHHYVWQNDGSIAYPSLKEQLCYLTLVAAGFKVARIDRLEWGRVANNDLAKLDFLCKRLPKLSLEFKRQENSPGDERKFPFHARQKPASEPRASASGNFITQPAPNCSTP